MKLAIDGAEIFVPDGLGVEEALARTTHLGIGAHQDDLEILAVDGVLRCFRRADRWFTGVVVTDGAGSPRAGVYGEYDDAAMQAVRRKEQKKAAVVGEYGAQALLNYPSAIVKDGRDRRPADDLEQLLRAARPSVVYTHNLADKHDTHVAVALRALEALRRLPPDERPEQVYGCELWRDLDWLIDADKIALDCSAHENVQAALLGVFDSQISGGKRYDLATMGRRRANATYLSTHEVDTATHTVLAMNLTPLVQDAARDVRAYVDEYIARFAAEVAGRLSRLA